MSGDCVLSLDTATPRMSVAVWRDGQIAARWATEESRRHGELLAPAVKKVTTAAGIRLGELTAVAVDVGPGLFTGLRVGVATAKALASALRVPVVAVTSLDALAHAHAGEAPVVAAVIDARRHQVFRNVYPAGVGGPAAVMDPAELASELAEVGRTSGGQVLAVGDGAVRYAEVLVGHGVRVAPEPSFPDAATVATLAASGSGEVTDAVGVRALYLRPPDVRIGWSRHDDPVEAGRG